MTLGACRKAASGERIRSVIVGSTLGWLLVAARDNGVCMIEFGDTRRVLRAGLCSRFPKGLLEAGDGMLHGWVQCVIDYLRVPEGSLNLPLDVQGTAFQKRVWNVLQSVPAGQTLTYAQVAQKVGNPNAVRAVARAVASNRVAIVIPCHRVIGTDGQLRGYRWGLVRKKHLLDRERTATRKRERGERG